MKGISIPIPGAASSAAAKQPATPAFQPVHLRVVVTNGSRIEMRRDGRQWWNRVLEQAR